MIIGIAQSIFEIIDYRYRFSTERFVVPITGPRAFCALVGFSYTEEYRTKEPLPVNAYCHEKIFFLPSGVDWTAGAHWNRTNLD